MQEGLPINSITINSNGEITIDVGELDITGHAAEIIYDKYFVKENADQYTEEEK